MNNFSVKHTNMFQKTMLLVWLDLLSFSKMGKTPHKVTDFNGYYTLACNHPIMWLFPYLSASFKLDALS